MIENDNLTKTDLYIEKIRKEGFFAGFFEANIISEIFNINVLILKKSEKYNGFIQQCKFKKNNDVKPLFILDYQIINKTRHFNVIHTKNGIIIISKIIY